MKRIQNIIALSLVGIFSAQAITPDVRIPAYCISLHEYKLLCTKLDQWYAIIRKEVDQLEFGTASLKKRVGPYEITLSIKQSTKKLVDSLSQSKSVNIKTICEYIENSAQILVGLIKDNTRCPLVRYKKVSIPQGVNAYYIEESARKDIISACDKIGTIIKEIKSITVHENNMTSSFEQQVNYKLVCKDIDNAYETFDKSIRTHFENYNRVIINVGQGQLISEQDIKTIKSSNDAFNHIYKNLLERLKSKVTNIDEVGRNLNQITDHIILTLTHNVSILELLRERSSVEIVIPCFKNEYVIGLLSVLRNCLEHIKTIVKSA